MTRKEIVDECEARIGVDGSTDTTTHNRVISFLNNVIQGMALHVAAEIRSGILRTESGRTRYGLDPDVGQLLDPMQSIEDGSIVEEVPPSVFDSHIVKPESTGQPAMYTLRERVGTMRQPATKIRFGSDSASDTQAITVYGIVEGKPDSESVTLPGSATVGVLTTYEYEKITQSPVAASAAVGTITFTGNSSSGDSTLPTAAAGKEGDITLGTITVGNTTSTNFINPGSLITIEMSGSDTAADQSKEVRIEGDSIIEADAIDGILAREDISTGADSTSVVLSSGNFTSIARIAKAWDATNTLIVKGDPNQARVLAVIPPNRRSISIQHVDLYPEPTGNAVQYWYRPRVANLLDDNDEPPFDPQYHSVLLKWTYQLLKGWTGDVTGDVDWSTNPEFLADIEQVQRSMDVVSNTNIVVGGGASRRRNRSRHGLVLPGAHYDNR